MATATNPERRKLSFATLDEVVADAENLLAKGYDRAGNWDLAQVCLHLADWLRFPVEGFPVPFVMRPMFWLLRNTFGPGMKRKVLAEGMPAGNPTIRSTVAVSGGDPTAAVAKLKEAAKLFANHTGRIRVSPIFGKMDKEETLRLQLRHCEHHLSFLIPK
ncbi:MAG: DUF1569 domain-containing protein [Planctomycetes bacterium]|nr:DUF1569 domain-containing protein [Planctomycetota bacterium]